MGSFAQLWWSVNCLLFFYCCWTFRCSFGRSAGVKVVCRPLICSFILIGLMCCSWAGITDVEPWRVALYVCKKLFTRLWGLLSKWAVIIQSLKHALKCPISPAELKPVSNDSDWSELGAIVSNQLEGIPFPTKHRLSAPVITEGYCKMAVRWCGFSLFPGCTWGRYELQQGSLCNCSSIVLQAGGAASICESIPGQQYKSLWACLQHNENRKVRPLPLHENGPQGATVELQPQLASRVWLQARDAPERTTQTSRSGVLLCLASIYCLASSGGWFSA